MNRLAKPDVHVSVAQQKIAFDLQFFPTALAKLEIEQVRRLQQGIVTRMQGMKRNVRWHNQCRLRCRCQECILIFQAEGSNPAFKPCRVACFVNQKNAFFEDFENDGQCGSTHTMTIGCF